MKVTRSAPKSGTARIAARPKKSRRKGKVKASPKRRQENPGLGNATRAQAADTSAFQPQAIVADDVSAVSPLRQAMDACAARYVKPKQSSMTVQEFCRGIMPSAIGPRNAADCESRMVTDLREYSGGAPVRGLLLRAGRDSKGFYVIAASAKLPDHDWTFEAVYQHRA